MSCLFIQNIALFLIGSNPMTYILTGFADTWLQKFLSNFSRVFFYRIFTENAVLDTAVDCHELT